ncbi:MAG TPA: uridine kinase [Candidatus Limiplasma stercoravium]|nr:uridine kinase [Candidatus Limiplasma stercoravium]
MLVIGICGASGSGKSTLAEELSRAIGEGCTILNHDCYYRDHPSLTLEERSLLNYDEPEIFDHDLFLEDIKRLLDGKPITRKRYDYAHHRRDDTDDLIEPPEVLIIEGIHVFYDERLCELMFLKLYMSVDADICLLRRIARDINERGRTIDNISVQYLSTVKPMYDKHIRNYIEFADVIVAHGGRNARIVQILAGYVRDELRLRSRA